MSTQPHVELATAILHEDPQTRELLARGLEAYARLQDALASLQQPETFLARQYDWSAWEADLRDCLNNFGAVFMGACIARLGQLRSMPMTPAPSPPESGVERSPEPPPPRPPAPTLEVIRSPREDAPQAPHEPLLDLPPEPEAELADEPAPRASGIEGEAREVAPEIATPIPRNPEVTKPAVNGKPRSAPVSITPEVLERLKKKVGQRAWKTDSTLMAAAPRGPSAQELMADMRVHGQHLMDCFEVEGRTPLRLLVEQLDAASDQRFLHLCRQAPLPIQKTYIELVAALAWLFQARHPQAATQVNNIFPRLINLTKDGRLSFVHGLSKRHEAKSGDWRSDAWMLWRRLRLQIQLGGQKKLDPGTGQKMLGELLDESEEDDGALQQGLQDLLAAGLVADTRVLRLLAPAIDALKIPQLRSLRQKVRDQLEEDEREDNAQEACGPLPEDWPHLDFTRGRAAVLIGSAGKKHQIDNIREAFGFASLDWIESCRRLKRVQALARGIQPGDERVFLVMLRYTSHSASGMMSDHRDHAHVITVDSGFGVHAVRRAIEHARRPQR